MVSGKQYDLAREESPFFKFLELRNDDPKVKILKKVYIPKFIPWEAKSLPMYLEKPEKSSYLFENMPLWTFAMLKSNMYYVWYQSFSPELPDHTYYFDVGKVLYTFPCMKAYNTKKKSLEELGQDFLDAKIDIDVDNALENIDEFVEKWFEKKDERVPFIWNYHKLIWRYEEKYLDYVDKAKEDNFAHLTKKEPLKIVPLKEPISQDLFGLKIMDNAYKEGKITIVTPDGEMIFLDKDISKNIRRAKVIYDKNMSEDYLWIVTILTSKMFLTWIKLTLMGTDNTTIEVEKTINTFPLKTLYPTIKEKLIDLIRKNYGKSALDNYVDSMYITQDPHDIEPINFSKRAWGLIKYYQTAYEKYRHYMNEDGIIPDRYELIERLERKNVFY